MKGWVRGFLYWRFNMISMPFLLYTFLARLHVSFLFDYKVVLQFLDSNNLKEWLVPDIDTTQGLHLIQNFHVNDPSDELHATRLLISQCLEPPCFLISVAAFHSILVTRIMHAGRLEDKIDWMGVACPPKINLKTSECAPPLWAPASNIFNAYYSYKKYQTIGRRAAIVINREPSLFFNCQEWKMLVGDGFHICT